jgi:hypothetical protein
MAGKLSRKPPADVARTLRKEAGFGCCLCGNPYVQYHHIVAWADEEHFRPDDMMILCPSHHAVCTAGGLDEEQQRAAKANPRNIATGLVKGDLWVTSKKLRVRFGGTVAINVPKLLVIDNRPIVSARLSDDGRLLISAEMEDSSGQVVGRLIDNEWDVLVNGAWDFNAGVKQATIHEKKRDIMFSVDARKDEVTIEGRWYRGKQRLLFGPKKTELGKTVTILNSVAQDCGELVSIQTEPRSLFGLAPPSMLAYTMSDQSTEALLKEWEACGWTLETINGLWLWDRLRMRKAIPAPIDSSFAFGQAALVRYRERQAAEGA